MIRKIVLENYMSHGHTVIEPADGLTVLVGPNNCGKSAVVAALETLCFNPGGDYMVRHGTKECSVTVETDDGHVVTWRRKSGTVSYTIDGREVGRLGRGGVPDDLHQILRLPKVRPPDAKTAADAFDLHFAHQKAPVFLLDQSRGRAATFFASSSDAEKLLEMQRRHRDNTAAARRDQGRLEGEIADLDAKLAALAPLDELDADAGRLEVEYEELTRRAARVEALANLIARLEECRRRRECLGQRVQALADLHEPPAWPDVRPLESAGYMLAAAQWRRQHQAARLGALVPLLPPPPMEDEHSLEALIRTKVNATRREAAAREAAAALAPLLVPPVPHDTVPLDRAIAKLRQSEARRTRHAAVLEAMGDLPAPPSVSDAAPLQDLSRRATRLTAASDQHARQLAELDRQLAALRAEAERWAESHPACPLCGGEVDADRLLAGTSAHHACAEGGADDGNDVE